MSHRGLLRPGSGSLLQLQWIGMNMIGGKEEKRFPTAAQSGGNAHGMHPSRRVSGVYTLLTTAPAASVP